MRKIFASIFLIIFLFPITIMAEEISVSNFEELKEAINNSESEILLTSDINVDSTVTVTGNIKITGNNKTINRAANYKGILFTIPSGTSLELNNLVVDGGASKWSMDYENRYYTQANNKGYVRVPTLKDDSDNEATNTTISNTGNLLLNNVTFQNIACTVSGCAINGKGNNTINNSTFNHIGSSKGGGAIYLSGGTTTIVESTFKDNIAGYNVNTSINGGALYSVSAVLVDISKTNFEDNFAQGNGGALFLSKSNIAIKDSNFKHNMCGNDGSAIDLENNTTTAYSVKIEDSIFEKNHGFATTGQSMGTIWIGSKWSNTSDSALIFKNLVFKENIAKTGGGISDNSANTYANFENIEVYENEVDAGSFVYGQGVNYKIDGLNVHDNNCTNGAAVYASGASFEIDNAKIVNNTSTSSGTGIYLIAGSIKISNSEISENTSTDGRGAGFFVRGYYDGYNPSLIINNSVIKNNNSAKEGGGIYVRDNENIFSSIIIDDSSKIYDNSSEISGDDFVYLRDNNSDNTSSNTITLDNISIAGITGIDGWYHDNEGDRFLETENPTIFDNYIQYNGSGLYLKAAGISSYSYDFDGGESSEILPIEVRYGQDYVVPDDEPNKDGYDFVGWNTKPDGTGVTLKPGDEYDGSDGFVLFAMYQPNAIIDVPDTDVISYNLLPILLAIFFLGLFIVLFADYKLKKNEM